LAGGKGEGLPPGERRQTHCISFGIGFTVVALSGNVNGNPFEMVFPDGVGYPQ
jgi:hypothetical protein